MVLMLYENCNIFKNSKQNIIAKTSLNTKTDKIEKLSKTQLFPSSVIFLSNDILIYVLV